MTTTEMTDQQLIDEYLGTYQMVYELGSYGTRDMILLDNLAEEINRRGYEIYQKPAIRKIEEDELEDEF